mgnify:CR=1 FL=1
MTDNNPSSPPKASRRDFLKIVWAAISGLAVLETGGVFFAYLQPRLAEGEFGSRISAGLIDDFPPGSVTHVTNGRFYLVCLPDGGFLAIYHRCTHLGCTVPWDQAAQKFICPCHSSRFDMQGSVENPPAPRPLDLFPIQIIAGEVLVDTSTILQRQSFDIAQVVYP